MMVIVYRLSLIGYDAGYNYDQMVFNLMVSDMNCIFNLKIKL